MSINIFHIFHYVEIIMETNNIKLNAKESPTGTIIEEINTLNYKKYLNEYFKIKRLIKMKNAHFWGLSIGEKPIAFAGIVTKGGKSTFFNVDVDIYIESLYTFKDFRGKGYMTYLLNEILKKYTYNKLFLCVNELNEKAHEIYKNWGFIDCKSVSVYKKYKIVLPKHTLKDEYF